MAHGSGVDSRSLLDAICAGLDRPPSAELRESIGFFVDHLFAAVSLGVPDALTDQLRWQTRRLHVLDPELDTGLLSRVTRSAIARRLGDDRAADELTRSAGDHLDRALDAVRDGGWDDQPDAGLTDLARDYLDLALAERHDQAVDLVLASGLTAHDVLLRVLEPAQAELGRRWERDLVSVAQEHETTALTQRVMALLRGRSKSTVLHGRTVLAGVVGEEQHSVGLGMVVDLLGLDGWVVERVPDAVNHRSVVDRVALARPDVLALSVTLFKHVVELRAVVDAVKADPRTRHVPVVVGGRPFRSNPALADLVGADAWAVDGEGAVEACRRATAREVLGHGDVDSSTLVPRIETVLGLAAQLRDDASMSRHQRDLASGILSAGRQLMRAVEHRGGGPHVAPADADGRGGDGIVDLDELVESVLVGHQDRASRRDIVVRQIRMPPERGDVHVEGRRQGLEQVVATLLDNAVELTPRSGVVTVRVRRSGGQVAVAVADEGPAIPPGDDEAIFAALDTSPEGTAAPQLWRGLALVRGIAEHHGGTLVATSDPRGSVFTLRLPLSVADLEHEAPTDPDHAPHLTVVPGPGNGPAV